MSLLRTVSFRRGVPAGQRNDLCPAGAMRRDPRCAARLRRHMRKGEANLQRAGAGGALMGEDSRLVKPTARRNATRSACGGRPREPAGERQPPTRLVPRRGVCLRCYRVVRAHRFARG